MSTETYSFGLRIFLERHHVFEQSKLHAISASYLTETKLKREIKKIGKKKEGIFYSEELRYKIPGWRITQDSSFSGCAWELSEFYQHKIMGKSVVVEAFPNGTIIVRGSPDATTLILLSEWRKNKGILFKALQKSLANPMIIAL